MNRISFSGSSLIIEEFVHIFLREERDFSDLHEESSLKYCRRLGEIVSSEGVDRKYLERVLWFLVNCDVDEGEIERLITCGRDELVQLARDAEMLEKHKLNRNIKKFYIVDEADEADD
ncbi:MAG: hypothetical protein JW814_06800 [Candidatus Krumholzibacteriota bacterium]|nr:hypothetical protein [Candidatus Krumholzibacteriota bacterium]